MLRTLVYLAAAALTVAFFAHITSPSEALTLTRAVIALTFTLVFMDRPNSESVAIIKALTKLVRRLRER